MTALLLGQILGVSFACGLNLYLTVASLGVLSRIGLIETLPPGLQGLESMIVIASAALLYLVEAVIDKIRHADSVWDAVHTFIRPPAAALLAVGALWGHPPSLLFAAAAIALLVALIAHGTKAGVRLTLNTAMRTGHAWLSIAEDLVAVSFATLAFLNPALALVAIGTILVLLLVVGPRYWRAFRLGARALAGWIRTLFYPARWREADEIPHRVRALLDPRPLAGAPPRGARSGLHELPSAGPYRNGWLVIDSGGGLFVYRTLFGHRRVDLPAPTRVEVHRGVWADVVRVEAENDVRYRIYLLKDGPPPDIVIDNLQQAAP